MGTFAGKPPGSGANFKKLSGTLAARGAHNPGALAAWIGRKKYGRKGFAKLGQSHSNLLTGLLLAEPYTVHPGEDSRCPACGKMNEPDARYCDQCGAKMPDGNDSEGDDDGDEGGSSALQTPSPATQSKTGFSPQQVSVKGSGSVSSGPRWAPNTFSNTFSSVRGAIELARRLPVSTLDELIVSRNESGAVIRHRLGGATIGEIRRTDRGWASVTENGTVLPTPHSHQRGALAEVIRTWNTGTGTLHRAAREAVPLQPAPAQTPLMEQFGIPAIRLATPTAGASDGPRITSASGDSGEDLSGLSPRGATIYKKLRAKGFVAARAKAFAMRAQNFGGAGK